MKLILCIVNQTNNASQYARKSYKLIIIIIIKHKQISQFEKQNVQYNENLETAVSP
jgi:hypothetical protein